MKRFFVKLMGTVLIAAAGEATRRLMAKRSRQKEPTA